MADELGPDDMHNLWSTQPVDPCRYSPADLRRQALILEGKMRRGFRGMAALMTLSAAVYVSFLYFFPRTILQFGASLTLSGYLYCAFQLYKRWPVTNAPSGPASATSAQYRAELVRQRDFCVDAWKTFLLPVVPGPAILAMGFLAPGQGVVQALCLTTALILSPFVLAVPLLQRRARTLQREIDQLDSLLGQPS